MFSFLKPRCLVALLLFSGSALAAPLSFNEGGKWYEDNAITDGFHFGFLQSERNDSYFVGVTNGRWGSVGRFFTPPAGKNCSAYIRARFADAVLGVAPGETIVKVLPYISIGALEVIDADTWNYKKKLDFTFNRPFGRTNAFTDDDKILDAEDFRAGSIANAVPVFLNSLRVTYS